MQKKRKENSLSFLDYKDEDYSFLDMNLDDIDFDFNLDDFDFKLNFDDIDLDFDFDTTKDNKRGGKK